MDFQLNEEQQAFQQLAKDFAREELAPHAAAWDRDEVFPIDTIKQAASLGFAGIYVSEDIGGAALGRTDAALIFEQLSQACVSTAAYLSIHNMVTAIIDQYAKAKFRSHWGKRLTSMDVLASYCLTEANSGSDAASLTTTARREGEHYIVNGAKAFISGGSVSDVYLCMVRTGDATHRGISCLLVEKDTPGLSFGKKEDKLGWRSQPTTAVFFENCKVPASHLVGEEGQGFKIAINALNGGRINIGACSLGGASACLNFTREYMRERHQFKQALTQFQALQFKFADMLTEFEAARLMVYRAAAAMDKQLPESATYCAMAKRLATDVGFQITDQALQLHGGYGYLADYPIERYFRDLRVHQILEGTNEIMRLIIAKNTLHDDYLI